MSLEKNIADARRCLAEARIVTVLSGAGISAESGIPTFRGANGLWKKHDPMTLATLEAFTRDPSLVWEWYNYRRGIIGRAEPNEGHKAIVKLEEKLNGNGKFTLVTQNIDGLHRKAGSRNILELHGNIWKVRCIQCGRVEEDMRNPIPVPPNSSCCDALLRPHVVWFGESLDPLILEESIASAQNCNVMLVVGTSGTVHPAASLALHAVKAGGAFIEVNQDPTPLSPYAKFSLQGKAGEILPQLIG